jgi:ribosomal protein S8
MDYDIIMSSQKAKIYIKELRIKKFTYISKPSRRVYIGYRKLLSIPYSCIISTSQGLMTKESAIKLKLGGVLLMKIE